MLDQFHHYKIIKAFAKKYSHSTYLAAPLDDPERRVVLIVFSSSLFLSSHEREIVLEKARSLKALQHPHLVPLLDLGIVDGQPFVVREYVPSWSLRSYLKQLAPKRFPLQDALTLLLQVGEALVSAHSHQIFHGNLKPENILLDAQGRALLTDFALLERGAVMVRDQTTEEYAFCYLAPEQLVSAWDAYADQYAMGCLSYELITGRVPFATESFTSLVREHFYSIQPAPLSEKVPDLPPSLEAAVFKALAKNPRDRFEDLSLFLEVMRAAVPSPPAFPFLRPGTAEKQKPSSVLAPSHKEMASAHPLSQRHQTASSIGSAEMTIDEIFKVDDSETPLPPVKNEIDLKDAFVLIKHEKDSETTFMLVPKEEDLETAFAQDEMTEAQTTDIDEAQPLTTRALAHRRLFLRVIFAGLLIATTVAYATFSIKGSDNPVQPIVLIQPSVPAETQLAVSLSPRTTLQSSPQTTIDSKTNNEKKSNVATKTNIATKTNKTPQSTPVPQSISASTPTPTPIPQTRKSDGSSTTPSSPAPTPMPTPTPTPTPTSMPQTTTVNDHVLGTGHNQFNYVGGGWVHGSKRCQGNPCEYDSDNSWDNTPNDYVTVTFTGVQLRFYGVLDSKHGIGAVSIDGGSETMINFYTVNRAGNQLLWTSPTLSAGTHTFKLRVTGNKDSRSSNTYLAVDRVDIIS